MADHLNLSKKVRYFKICPRGFVNEIRYIRITSNEQSAIIEHEYD